MAIWPMRESVVPSCTFIVNSPPTAQKYFKPLRALKGGSRASDLAGNGLYARHFAHKLHNVAVRIAERNHPEVVGLHRSNQAWGCLDLCAHFDQPPVSGVDIRDTEIKDGAGMIELRRTCGAEHQT